MDGSGTGASGYEEIAHTADLELRVWAQNLTGLLITAACGMYHLQGVNLEPGGRFQRTVDVRAEDAEGLLVAYLSELLFHEEAGEAFDTFQLTETASGVVGTLDGAAIASGYKEIKAVTYHNLAIRHLHDRLEAHVVFDI
ncbi:MAG TPA: archease [Anaerolinea sp.]|nr:archease [Anaerolinea sp.]